MALKTPEEYEFPSAGVLRDPYPFYSSLRAHAPVYRVPEEENFLVSGYDEVSWCFKHPELLSNRRLYAEASEADLAAVAAGQRYPRMPTMSDADPPIHTNNRHLTMRVFTPARLRRYEPIIAGIADELIDAFANRGTVEWVSEYAKKLPMYVICDLVGFDRSMGPQMRKWADDYLSVVSRFYKGQPARELHGSVAELYNFLTDEVEKRQKNPADDLLTEIVQGTYEDGSRPDMTALVNIAKSLAVGAHETTTSLLANVMYLLVTNSDELARVSADPSLIPRVIEETLRAESPVQWLWRTATEDLQLGGVMIPKGSQVRLMCGAANRDPVHFNDAEDLRPDRSNLRDHLAFGLGIHYCLGAPLARLEARITLERVLSRFTDLKLDDAAETEVVGVALIRYVPSMTVAFRRHTGAA
jgi:cytochrome P450